MAAVTDRGRLRAHNEDAVAVDPGARLAIVADGMGGHNAGEVASRMALDLTREGIVARLQELGSGIDALGAETLVRSEIERANAAIYEAGASRGDYAGMGTTVVVALWHGCFVTAAHVGDSRLYRLRRGELAQLTRDHSVVQERVERGTLTPEEARLAPFRNMLTRALGTQPHVRSDVRTTRIEAGDVYLLCSDGLTEMLLDSAIAETLERAGADIDSAAEALVALANSHGGVDNISVALVRVAGAADPPGT
jgi:protein phosphatase